MRFGRSLRKQLGFLHLTTGGNGTGKTLFTLKDVRELQERTGRPVFFYGFEALQPLLDFGWKPFEPAEWQDLPDGSICVVDECQNVLPTRGTGQPPAWVAAIAEVHRKRGFDFFLITQHPLNFDAFVRRLIAAPGWHRHFKASTMSDSSNELKWSSVKDNPQTANSGLTGEVTPRAFPKEVYTWYKSASLHTANKRIPLKVWGAILGVIVAFGMVGFAVYHFLGYTNGAAKPKQQQESGSSSITKAFLPGTAPGAKSDRTPLTTMEYLDQRKPRLVDFPHTAPLYDQVTQPTEAPYPAACVSMGKRCECYTQQATVMRVTHDVCIQIVQRGYFMDWKRPESAAPAAPRRDDPVHVAAAPSQPPVVINMPAQAQAATAQSGYLESLALRNAQVRSELSR